ncbi:MAG TPA: mandelate racemase/muconate lactonizing enzyme family protein, partial [Candidatus Latescibacteria bacterium]|nr:mandelate racemase/muconate lactonizing enzyme family protein [Candidatus Latescibacterota bacterium]
RHDLLLPSEQIVNGRIKVPDRPGLGVELNPEAVKKYRVNP